MLRASTRAELGLDVQSLEQCPSTINTSMGRMEQAMGIMCAELVIRLQKDDVMDASFMKAKAIVLEAGAYDV